MSQKKISQKKISQIKLDSEKFQDRQIQKSFDQIEDKKKAFNMFWMLKKHKESGKSIMTKLMKKNLKKKFDFNGSRVAKITFNFHIPQVEDK